MYDFTYDFFLVLFSELGHSLLIFPAGILGNQFNLVSRNPNYVTGFIDGEGCFSITIYKESERRTG